MARPGRCITCGNDGIVHARGRCSPCYWRHKRQSEQSRCPRCETSGYLREETGWCGPCTRWSRHEPKTPTPRICLKCGELRRHGGRGLCARCLQAEPTRAIEYADRLSARLPEPPSWLPAFAVWIAALQHPSRAVAVLRELRTLLVDGDLAPTSLVQRCDRDSRAVGSLHKALTGFFLEAGLVLPDDRLERLAQARRDHLLADVPDYLRSAVLQFAAAQVAARARARRVGTAVRSHRTIEINLAVARDLAHHLPTRINGWEQVAAGDVEAFLASQPRLRARRLSSLRAFFRHCREHKLILADPTRGLRAEFNPGFRGQTVDLNMQRRLFARWTRHDTPAHEALVGLLALLHAGSAAEIKDLLVSDVDPASRTVLLGRRPRPVPLDPPTWEALQRCLRQRAQTRTANPHVLVTKLTKTGGAPVSGYYMSHILDAADTNPRVLRSTRLAILVTTCDPVLVAEALGLHPRATMYYLAGGVDKTRLPMPNNDIEHMQ